MADGMLDRAGDEPLDVEQRRELRDAREQSMASREMFVALGRAGGDPESILDAIVERAARLCGADAAQLYLVDGNQIRLSRMTGNISGEFRRYLKDHPVARSRTSLVGRVAEDGRTQQIADVLADSSYARLDLQRIGGYRTLLSAPMMLDGEVVGVFSLWRMAVSPFDDSEIRLLDQFGLQGAIALRQVGLLRALESRSAELAARVAQLEALREVGEAVSSSLDLDEVLQSIVTNAVELTGTDGGSIMEYLDDEDAFSVRTACGSSPELIARLRAVAIERDSTLVGRAALEGRPLEVADLAREELDPTCRSCTTTAGARCSPYPCCGSTTWSAPWSYDDARQEPSTRAPWRSCRSSPASPPWPSTTRACSASSPRAAPSSRWPATTSPSSWPACPTSCAPR